MLALCGVLLATNHASARPLGALVPPLVPNCGNCNRSVPLTEQAQTKKPCDRDAFYVQRAPPAVRDVPRVVGIAVAPCVEGAGEINCYSHPRPGALACYTCQDPSVTSCFCDPPPSNNASESVARLWRLSGRSDRQVRGRVRGTIALSRFRGRAWGQVNVVFIVQHLRL